MKKSVRQGVPVIALALISAVLLYLRPESRTPFGTTILDYAMELIVVLPAVLLLMGLLSLFISNEFISTHLGSESGLKGMAVAFLLGTLPTGPVYMAFPIARTLRDKGARVANFYIFLSAWACIKIPQELVELRFLGFEFMAYRLTFTIIMVSLLSFVVEKFAH
ncbi:MAG: permease [Spirochaetia bacterium]|nr:permease [Spirochaetia bacterium]